MLKQNLNSGKISSLQRNDNSYNDLYQPKGSEAKIAKFGMILEAKKAKRIFHQMNKKPNTKLHHKLHLNVATRGISRQK